MDLQHAPVTFFLIALNVVISIMGFSSSKLIGKTILWPYYVKRNHQYYRLITSGFIHADWMHLFFNMFTFYFFGSNLEYIFTKALPNGMIWYAVLYMVALVLSDLPSFFRHQDDPHYRALGASGAVSAVVFGVIIFDPWTQIRLYGVFGVSALVFAILYIIYCVYQGRESRGNVNHDAHLWGSVFGLAFTLALLFIFRTDVFPYILEDLKHPSILGRTKLGLVLEYLLMHG